MAKSRLKTLSELRRVRVDSQILMVHRCGKYVYLLHLGYFCNWLWICRITHWILKFRWVKLPGTDLLPGDVVSIGRSSGPSGEDKSVPADMLLLAGSAIVNEAILTGESTPQWKVVFLFPSRCLKREWSYCCLTPGIDILVKESSFKNLFLDTQLSSGCNMQ